MKRWLTVFVALSGCAIIAASWGLSIKLRRTVNDVERMPLSYKLFLELELKINQIGEVSNIIPGNIIPGPKHCEVKFDPVPDRFDVKHAINLVAMATLPPDSEECKSRLVFYATGFSVLPKDEVAVTLSKEKRTQEVVFNIMPKEVGKQAIVYGTDDKPQKSTPLIFQYPWINPALSIWFPVLGTLFGGMLTIPWWLRFFGIPSAKSDDDDDDEDKDDGTNKKKQEKAKPKSSKKHKVS
jgi:hypothetical protein